MSPDFLARILLDAGADIRAVSRYPNMPYDGKTPLDVARESGDPLILDLLQTYAGKG